MYQNIDAYKLTDCRSSPFIFNHKTLLSTMCRACTRRAISKALSFHKSYITIEKSVLVCCVLSGEKCKHLNRLINVDGLAK